MDVQRLDESLAAVRCRLPECHPDCALVLGSGWAGIEEAFPAEAVVPYSEIPHLGIPGVAGHKGRLVLCRHGGRELLLFQGRRHWYEGAGWEPVALPVYLSLKLGVRDIILTNAAGGIREDLAPGTLMAVDDHINAMGSSPLTGNRDAVWGQRFVDQTRVYDPRLRECMDRAAERARVALAHGVYLAVCGPEYETPAEVRAFRALGADAVGMSTVPEAMLANAAGLRVAALSCIANQAAGAEGQTLKHDDVLRIAAETLPAMKALLSALIEETAPHAAPGR